MIGANLGLNKYLHKFLSKKFFRHYLSYFIIILEYPDGGDGGHGGSVYFRATGRLSSLYDLRRAHFFGNNGKYGLVRIQLNFICYILI